MKKIVALLLTVLIVASSLSTGFSAVYADESHTSEIMTDEPEVTEELTESSEPDEVQDTTEVNTYETEESSETTEATEVSTEDTTEETEKTTDPAEEPTEPSEEPTEETEEPEEPVPEQPVGPSEGDNFVGDINDDGIVNIIDVTETQKIIAGFSDITYNVWGDTNGDGILNIDDATMIQKLIAYGSDIPSVEKKNGKYSPDKGAVINLKSSGSSQTEIVLTWEQSEGASGYEVFAYSYANGYVKIGDTAENSYTIITDGAEGYNVCVRAWYEEDGEILLGDFSGRLNVASKPYAGVFKEVLRNGDGSFSVFATADKSGYILNTEDYEAIGIINGGCAVVSEDYEGASAVVENRFIYGNITSSSFGNQFVIEGEMPVLTANILVQGNNVTINWNKIAGVSGYEVFKMNNSGEYESIADTTGVSFSDTVESGSKNLYSVKYYVLKNGEKQYFSENLLEAVTAPSAPASASVWKGNTITLNINSSLEYTLESLNPEIAAVSGKEITGIASGTAKIKIIGEWEDDIYVTVTVRQAPTKLTLSTYNMIILETEKLTIKATMDPGAESTVKFTSSDPSKATVNSNGDVIAYKAGTVTITAETENGIKAQCQVKIYPVDSRTFKVDSKVMSSSAWDSTQITTLKKGTQAFVLETKGAWLYIRYGGDTGWVYNKSFNTSIKNYSTIDKTTLPVIIDDWIFDNGTSIKTIFNYVRSRISYRNLGNGSVEDLCVHVLRYGTGACYHYGALLYYMLDRAGYDAIIVDGIDLYTGGGPHRWNMVKVNGYWYHIDATPIIGLPDFYLVKDSAIEGIFSWDRNKYPKTPV